MKMFCLLCCIATLSLSAMESVAQLSRTSSPSVGAVSSLGNSGSSDQLSASAGRKFKRDGMKSAESLHFEGYVTLPKRTHTLSIMDYLTIYNGSVFVGGMSTNNLSMVELDRIHLSRAKASHDAAEIPGLAEAHGLAVDPALQLGFVTSSGDNTVAVIDMKTYTVIKKIKVASDPDAVLFDATSMLVYVVNAGGKLATLIDPSTQAVAGTIALGGSGEFPVVDAGNGLLYQNLEDTGEIVVVDIAGRKVLERWPLTGCANPTGLAIDREHRRLFAGCKQGRLVIVNMDTHAVIASLPIGKWPDSVAYDATLHRIYTTGGLGRLVVLDEQDPDHYAVREWINTHYGAHTLAVDPETHRVFLACLGYFGYPRIAVFDAK
jgi:YVTN family beta-propeller protein